MNTPEGPDRSTPPIERTETANSAVPPLHLAGVRRLGQQPWHANA
jgi:hypothetical protein